MNKLSRKFNRYVNLVKKFKNWPAYLAFKIAAPKDDIFTFKLRDSFSIKVPKKMLGPFRECFLDEVYLRHIHENTLGSTKPTIVDIGANVGYFSLFMYSKFPACSLYAFEPMPYCFNMLNSYKKEYKNYDFHVYQEAVSDQTGSIDIYTNTTDGFTTTSSLYDTEQGYKISVATTSLEEFLKKQGISKIDLLKLDCEGAEYAILYNLPDTMWSNISALTLEAHNIDQESKNIIPLVAYLKSKNYNVVYSGNKEINCGHIWASRPK